jgi:hypothetical protein
MAQNPDLRIAHVAIDRQHTTAEDAATCGSQLPRVPRRCGSDPQSARAKTAALNSDSLGQATGELQRISPGTLAWENPVPRL